MGLLGWEKCNEFIAWFKFYIWSIYSKFVLQSESILFHMTMVNIFIVNLLYVQILKQFKERLLYLIRKWLSDSFYFKLFCYMYYIVLALFNTDSLTFSCSSIEVPYIIWCDKQPYLCINWPMCFLLCGKEWWAKIIIRLHI